MKYQYLPFFLMTIIQIITSLDIISPPDREGSYRHLNGNESPSFIYNSYHACPISHHLNFSFQFLSAFFGPRQFSLHRSLFIISSPENACLPLHVKLFSFFCLVIMNDVWIYQNGFNGIYRGKIVLALRGNCTFLEKVLTLFFFFFSAEYFCLASFSLC